MAKKKPKDELPERCPLTIDLGDYLMTINKVQPLNIKAVIHYVSGRTEEILGKLKRDGSSYKSFNEKVAAVRKVSTVTDVELVKF